MTVNSGTGARGGLRAVAAVAVVGLGLGFLVGVAAGGALAMGVILVVLGKQVDPGTALRTSYVAVLAVAGAGIGGAYVAVRGLRASAGALVGRLRSDDRGAVSGEYVGVVVVVAAVVSALVVVPLAPTVRAWARYAVCSLFAGDCERPDALGAGSPDEPAAGELTDEDFEPDWCDVLTTEFSGEVGGSILFFDASTGLTFARTERSDGRTAFTVVDDGSLGIGAEIGAEFEGGVAEADVGAEARAGLKAELGSTWLVDREAADDFQSELIEETVEDRSAKGLPLVGDVANWIADQFNGDDIPEPDITYSAAGGEAGVDATAEAELLGEDVASAAVGVEGAVLLGREQDRSADNEADWTDSTYFQVDLSGEAGIGVLGAAARAEGSMTQVMKVTRGLDGELRSVELTRSVTDASLVGVGDLEDGNVIEGGSQSSVVETILLEATTAQDREVLEGWLDRGSHPDFAEFTNRRGKLSVLEYDGSESGFSLGAEVALGAKIGFSVGGDTLTNEVVDGYYFGAPDSSGGRTPVRYGSCLESMS